MYFPSPFKNIQIHTFLHTNCNNNNNNNNNNINNKRGGSGGSSKTG